MFTTDEETVAEHVDSELALRRGKRSTVQLIQNRTLQNIYIYSIYYIIYIIYEYIYMWTC